MAQLEAKGKYSKDKGGEVKVKGLSSIQYDVIMSLIRSWNKND